MESYKIENLTFTYPNGRNKALDNICLSVNRGEFITLCGKSGCGKTTLLRLLKSAVAPFGSISGTIFFEGKPLKDVDSLEQAAKIGFVMQDCDNQLVTDKVWHELVFGAESLGISVPEIRTRVSETASFFGIQGWFHKNVTELSGGQKQILNLASVMVMQPSVLILDEPTSRLDPIGAQNFFAVLEKINRELGTTVILSEHRLEEAFPLSDRVIVMDSGRITADDAPEKIGGILKALNHDMLSALPAPVRIFGALENASAYPVTVREGRAWLEKYSESNPPDTGLIPKPEKRQAAKETAIEIKSAYFRYEKSSPDVIKGLGVKINKGEFFALVGGNGTGKTTALSLMSGLNTPYRGEVRINGENILKIKNRYNGLLGVLPQNPQNVFVKNTVRSDLAEILSETKLEKEEKELRIKKVSALCRIENLLDSHPYDLSGGEQQRAALAKVLLTSPQILLLDEPTKGFDAHFKQIFAEILRDLKSKGTTVVMVSHDIEFCAENADRCAMFFDGSITSEGEPREFFAGKNFYTTAANRMARSTIPEAVLADDVILACGGKVRKAARGTQQEAPLPEITAGTARKTEIKKRRPAKRTLAAAIMIFLAIPLTIYTGVFYLQDRKYYIISMLIILETMLPFFMLFEARHPQARELVVISVICAIAVAGRAAFFMLPQFKPVTAIVIIAGVCFGGEAGFLVGAVTAFVSNFFFGQGPWTPWQMFAFGIIGFVSGVLAQKGLLRRKRLSLSIFGAAATFLLYGGIMNPSSLVMAQEELNFEMLKAAYISGAPFDAVHAASTAFFLWVISEPMIEKLDRIKEKYGLLR